MIGAVAADARGPRRGAAPARALRRWAAVVTTPAAASTITVSPSARSLAGGGADDGDDRLLAREDRGVRGRAAVGGDEREHLVEVEQRGVGRREVVRDEDERMPGVGHAGSGHAAQPRDDALGDVVEVGGALAEVAAHRGRAWSRNDANASYTAHSAVLSLRRCARRPRLRGVGSSAIMACASSTSCAAPPACAPRCLELRARPRRRLPRTRAVSSSAVERARRVVRRRQRLRHPGDRSLGDAQADPRLRAVRSSVSVSHCVVVGGEQLGERVERCSRRRRRRPMRVT